MDWTRAEHMAWCKRRALQYIDTGDLHGAVASMLSDMGKHDETQPMTEGLMGMMVFFAMQDAADGNAVAVRRWIEGYAE